MAATAPSASRACVAPSARWSSAASRPLSRYSRTSWCSRTSWPGITTSIGWNAGSRLRDKLAPVRDDPASFSADDLIGCYRIGVFPMAETRGDPQVFLVEPQLRGIIEPATFHLSRRLARTVRADPFEIRVDTAFRDVV